MTRPLAGPLGHLPRPRAIDEDAPHHLRRHPEKLTAVLPHDTTLVDQPQVLVHERGRLQGAAGALPSKVTGRTPAKIAIHDQNQAIARSQITRSPGMVAAPSPRRVVGQPLGVRIFPVTLTRVNRA